MDIDDLICPRCGGEDFRRKEVFGFLDEDDGGHLEYTCTSCGLMYNEGEESWMDGRDPFVMAESGT